MGQKKGMTWAGWVLAVLVAALLCFSASMKFAPTPENAADFEKFGFTADLMKKIGVVEVTCAVIYLIPQTAVLGAILVTGYLGGAVCTHVRLQEDFTPPVVAGVLVWLSLFLRDPRIRALAPLRRPLPPPTS